MSASSEVETAVGEGPGKENVIELLAAKKAALVAAERDYRICREMRDEEGLAIADHLRDALKVIIAELEIEAVPVREETGRKEAIGRLKGIKSHAGSLRAEFADDDKKIRALGKEIDKANAARTDRAREYEMLQAEANALTDRCGLPPLKLENIVEPPPIEVPAPWRYHFIRPSWEFCEHNLRQRRAYSEIPRESESYAIIMRMGLRNFRPLTAQEKEVLEDKEERKPDPTLAQAAVEATALGNLGVPDGHVHRG